MAGALDRLRGWVAGWTVLPVDHYTALGLDPQASEAEIQAACEATLARVTASGWARVLGFVCGQSPTRLRRARDELCDPLLRPGYDRHLAMLRVLFRYPPQT
ncbi:hypothetical protein [Hydrogenophaga sp. OTU3427]|uniref:hypothetical protein n=1 Tax=Hydrogenophaga sp. OTU3427 TaxID=3043856 RepID=UPI00313AFD9C